MVADVIQAHAGKYLLETTISGTAVLLSENLAI